MRLCKQCGKDISHRPTKAQYCDNRCKDAYNNANRLKSPPSALVASATPPASQAMPQDIGVAILEAIHETNRLLGLMLEGGSITYEKTTIERIELRKGPPPATNANDDDLLEVKKATQDTSRFNVPFCNLQLGLYGLGSIKHLSDLADEVLEFGILHGKLPTEPARAILNTRKGGGNAKPLAGADVPFSAPAELDFDDLL